jgi:protocatechuate 3,4-dioxygenase beta subunit
MKQRPDLTSVRRRRDALATLLAAAAPLAIPARTSAQAQHLRRTPSQTLGPFYPRNAGERPVQTDADLLAFAGSALLTHGVPLYLTGRVLDTAGNAIAGAEIEIWQCDANAVYHHPDGGAEAERDPNFQGYGRTQSAADGSFHFRTIRPVPYPGRTAHIHVRVQASGRHLATQLYLEGEAGNARDFIYRRLDAAERQAVTLVPRPTQSTHPLAQGTRQTMSADLVLA